MKAPGGPLKNKLLKRLRELERRVAAHTAQESARYSAHRRAQLAWSDSRERLRAILETAVEGIITIDERGVIESVNPAAERIFGYTARQLIGRNVSLLMPSPDREAHDGYIARYLRTGHAKIIGLGREVVGQRKDGTQFPMDLAVSEVRLADRRLFTGFVRDITERKRLEKRILEVSNREQRRIGQDLHDGLGQQLAGIELICQVLEQQLAVNCPSEAPRAAEIGRQVRAAIAHTRRLARGLVPVELEAGGLRSALEILAANATQLFGVRCVLVAEDAMLLDDPEVALHLYRIAQEAVTNAVRHGKATRVTLSLESVPGRLKLMIRDNGSGFSPRHAARNGMGLEIMSHRSRMIGAALRIQSRKGRGTSVFCLCSRPESLRPGEKRA